MAVVRVAGAGSEREVHRGVLALVAPGLFYLAGVRVEAVLVDRRVEDVSTLVEHVLGPVSVVNVPVEDSDSVGLALIEGRLGRDGSVVEKAKAHGVVGDRVMARRSSERERRVSPVGAVERRPRRPLCEPRRRERGVPGPLAHDGVGVPASAAVGDERLKFVDVRRVVDRDDLLPRRGVRLRVLDAVALRQPTPYRAQSVRIFRVSFAGVVFQTPLAVTKVHLLEQREVRLDVLCLYGPSVGVVCEGRRRARDVVGVIL